LTSVHNEATLEFQVAEECNPDHPLTRTQEVETVHNVQGQACRVGAGNHVVRSRAGAAPTGMSAMQAVSAVQTVQAVWTVRDTQAA
jgi:hypothetical protein